MKPASGSHHNVAPGGTAPTRTRPPRPERRPAGTQRHSRDGTAPRRAASPEPATVATARAQLTSGELAVLTHLAEGFTQHSAARRLDISARTLRRRLRDICARLGVSEPVEAVVWAAKRGLL